MELMSGTFRRRMLTGFALVAALASARFAYAGALSLESMAHSELVPSAVPALLEPIGESGRVGWKCAPERAAAAVHAAAAGLPEPGTSP